MPKSMPKMHSTHTYLDAECRQHKVVPDGRKSVFVQKRHQKAEADEDHDVDVLEKGVIGGQGLVGEVAVVARGN